jgi:hypothetical protein
MINIIVMFHLFICQRDAVITMESLLAGTAFVEGIAAIWGSVICFKAYCCCTTSSKTSPGYQVLSAR